MLQSILIVTITTSDLSKVEQAYTQFLNYQVVERSSVSETLAAVWGAPQTAGRRFTLMQPESGEPVFLRFVESKPLPDYQPLRTVGWNSAELLVTDPDDLATKLADSPFKIIGQPKNLAANEHVRAMQVIGPAREVLYLTRIVPGTTGFDLGSAKSFVDRVFIVVLGGNKLEAMCEFYSTRLKTPVTNAFSTTVTVLNKAYQLPADHQTPLALVQMPVNFLIELDEYPADAIQRPQHNGELPPAQAMVSFVVESLDQFDLSFFKAPTVLPEPPYNGRRVAVTTGAAGELIELIEK